MAESFSLRAEKLRASLFSRYDDLNALWDKAEEQITRMHIPRPVFFPYDTNRGYFADGSEIEVGAVCLGVQKIKGEWRICHGDYYDSISEIEWKPITECSADDRVSAASHVAGLFEEVLRSAEQFLPQVDRAINALRDFVSEDRKAQRPAPPTYPPPDRHSLNGRAK